MEKPPEKPRRRWFRFSLRTFFVLLSVLGVWLGVQVKWISDRHRVLDALAQTDGVVTLRSDGQSVHARLFSKSSGPAPWNLRMLGETGYEYIAIIYRPEADAIDFEQVAREYMPLFPEAEFVALYRDPNNFLESQEITAAPPKARAKAR